MAKPDLSAQGITTIGAIAAPTQPASDDYSGVWKHLGDGLLYELCKSKEDKDEPGKITHRLRVPPQKDKDGAPTHPGFYWEGSKEDFKTHFERA